MDFSSYFTYKIDGKPWETFFKVAVANLGQVFAIGMDRDKWKDVMHSGDYRNISLQWMKVKGFSF